MWRPIAVICLLSGIVPAAAMAADGGPGCQAVPLAGSAALSPAPVARAGSMPLKPSPRVAGYEIDATLDPDTHTIRGTERVQWRNRSDVAICTVYLHLDLNAYEGPATAYMAALRDRGVQPSESPGEWGHSQLTQVRQGGLAAIWIPLPAAGAPASDHTVVRVDLPQPVAPDETTTLDIAFVSRLPGAWAEAGHAGDFHLAAGWFPQIARLQMPGESGAVSLQWDARAFVGDFADREPADFDVRLDLPRNYGIAASGEPRGVAMPRGARRHHRFVQQDAATFTWAADPHFTQPLEYRYFPVAGPPLTLRVLFRPGEAAAAVNTLGTMADALAFYTSTLGPYPASTLSAVVVPPRAGPLGKGAFPGLLTSGTSEPIGSAEADLRVLEAVGTAYFPEDAGNAFPAGARRYLAERYRRTARHDTPAADGGWLRRLLAPWRAILASQLERTRTRLDDREMRVGHIAQVLHDLEKQAGAPAVDRALRTYWRSARASYPDATQARWLMAVGSGKAYEFQRAFANIDAGIAADDRIAHFSSDPLPGGAASTGKVPYRTVVVVQRQGIAVPQSLLVTFADGGMRRVRWDDARSNARFEWTTPARAVSAQLDPERQVRLDRNKLDDGRTLTADARPVARWTAEIAEAMQVLASWAVLP